MKLKANCSYLIKVKGLAGHDVAVQKITVVSITRTCYEIQWENNKSWEEIAAFDSRVVIVEELETESKLDKAVREMKKMTTEREMHQRRYPQHPPPYFVPEPRRYRPYRDSSGTPYEMPWRITCNTNPFRQHLEKLKREGVISDSYRYI